jgi:intraflagellar transport protein 46
LKYLDEPSNNQSDPTVLELQLRAKSKKLQYGDIVVRSIENADKNPLKIEKWMLDISELHRSKPPPQVNYKRNFPDIEKLMDVWPEEFEGLLENAPLPSPDLDLSLTEYAKILCTILDIPTYDNPIESLHVLFTLFIEFRNNPHFQARLMDGDYNQNLNDIVGKGNMGRSDGNYYRADILEIEADYNNNI